MPVLGLGLHVVMAVFFAVHAIRSGQDRYWLFILFVFPVLGSLVYGVAIWLPEIRHSRRGRALVRNVRRTLDPGRELREARDAFELARTSANRLQLANALAAAGQPDDAIEHYRTVLQGVDRGDPTIQIRLAQVLLDADRSAEARGLLEALIRTRPDVRSPEGHLTYACAVAATGDRVLAKEEFETLIGYYAGLEARARFAQVLADWGEHEAARTLCEQSLQLARRLPRYSRRLNQPWIEQMRRLAATS